VLRCILLARIEGVNKILPAILRCLDALDVTMRNEGARARFAQLFERGGDDFDLDRAVLLIAQEQYPTLNIEHYISQLDRFAVDARTKIGAEKSAAARVLLLRDYLFTELGFHGNAGDYFDARNSFLNDVIDRRTGIPITLAVVFMEVARRLDLELLGVGMPGHFIVKFCDDERDILLDPFNAGRELTVDDCREMVSGMYRGTLAFHPSFLAVVTKRQILTRILRNLKGIYAGVADHHRVLGIVERTLLLCPLEPVEIRDRGLAYMGLGEYGRALADLEDYLRRAPGAQDEAAIHERIDDLRKRQAQLN